MLIKTTKKVKQIKTKKKLKKNMLLRWWQTNQKKWEKIG
jgi:hypothetical protein